MTSLLILLTVIRLPEVTHSTFQNKANMFSQQSFERQKKSRSTSVVMIEMLRNTFKHLFLYYVSSY